MFSGLNPHNTRFPQELFLRLHKAPVSPYILPAFCCPLSRALTKCVLLCIPTAKQWWEEREEVQDGEGRLLEVRWWFLETKDSREFLAWRTLSVKWLLYYVSSQLVTCCTPNIAQRENFWIERVFCGLVTVRGPLRERALLRGRFFQSVLLAVVRQ